MPKVKPYVPTIGNPDWNIKEMDKESRKKLKSRLCISLITSEDEYQTVIGYMYKKFPYEMDLTRLPDGSENVPIQWNYSVARNKAMVRNRVTGIDQDMYAFVIYDRERDMEPVSFAGSYFKLGKAIDDVAENETYLLDADGNHAVNGKYQLFGNGYVMFNDPSYRRLGLATDLWWAEAQLYRQAFGIRFQREIQNEYSLKSTQKMFSDPSKCIITSPGRLKNDGTRCQIRCLLDYEDPDVKMGFEQMNENLKEIYNEPHWEFLKREGFHMDELTNYWRRN